MVVIEWKRTLGQNSGKCGGLNQIAIFIQRCVRSRFNRIIIIAITYINNTIVYLNEILVRLVQ